MRETDASYARLYPTTFSEALSSDDLTRAAKSRWDESYAAYRRAALVQGQITDTADSDARLLDQIVSRSQGAAGALQATQAGNELSALHVKQNLQLQTLLAAQARAETSDRARNARRAAAGARAIPLLPRRWPRLHEGAVVVMASRFASEASLALRREGRPPEPARHLIFKNRGSSRDTSLGRVWAAAHSRSD